jgi:hypothetical protein
MKVFAIICASILLLPLVSCAQQTRPGRWKVDGVPAEDTANHKAVNGFGAHLLVIRNPRDFIEMWKKPEMPQFNPAEDVAHDELLGVIVLFAGCMPDDQGNCNTEVDYLIKKPDGSIFADRKKQPLWKDVAPPGKITQLGKAILGFKTAQVLPKGEYKVTARVSDLIAKSSFDLETRFSIK